jgi:hypothetical protein
MKCFVCGNEAGKNRQGVARITCGEPCRIKRVSIESHQKHKKPKYCVQCGRSTDFCECKY